MLSESTSVRGNWGLGSGLGFPHGSEMYHVPARRMRGRQRTNGMTSGAQKSPTQFRKTHNHTQLSASPQQLRSSRHQSASHLSWRCKDVFPNTASNLGCLTHWTPRHDSHDISQTVGREALQMLVGSSWSALSTRDEQILSLLRTNHTLSSMPRVSLFCVFGLANTVENGTPKATLVIGVCLGPFHDFGVSQMVNSRGLLGHGVRCISKQAHSLSTRFVIH